ncbi:MAG TPA: LacI family DNA-binding transcriptional regulator [Thermoleophilaceae bacterium]|nr:LacI family DNA-binding transcriptional regulator [Thermoleophilaceae bacterium]
MTAPERLTIDDIAELAGVSTASVSRALNGRPGVSSATRAAIMKIAQDHQFTGNVAARALSSGKDGRIAVTLPHVHAEYFARILAGAAEVFHERGVSLMLETTAHSHDRQAGALQKLMRSGIDGALLMLPDESSSELEELYRSGLRFVVVDAIDPLTVPLPWITCAHAIGARDAMAHLLRLGHRRIGIITGEPKLLTTLDRLHGVRQALSAAGMSLDEELVRQRNYRDPDGGYSAAMELLSLPDPPTAIFAFNDVLAFGVLRAAHELGVAVPAQLSLVGFDDLEPASLVTPGLTTVRQPLARIGAVAAGLLLRWIDGDKPAAMHIELPVELVQRGSTAPPGER